ncbi:hypothetical protein [Pseudovibrio sp. SPO723]|nr:hypothetical protein [Pseudovibrio sp. SPO723]MDX5595639.1 hypothetical protein [Pseudovibrio sp. SPO723]
MSLTNHPFECMFASNQFSTGECVTKRRAGIGVPFRTAGACTAPRLPVSVVFSYGQAFRRAFGLAASCGAVTPILFVWPPEIGVSSGQASKDDHRRFAMCEQANDGRNVPEEIYLQLLNLSAVLGESTALILAMTSLAEDGIRSERKVDAVYTLLDTLSVLVKRAERHNERASAILCELAALPIQPSDT